jgi:hypothetical protein
MPTGSIASISYVASRGDGTVCNLALFGNFAEAELRP